MPRIRCRFYGPRDGDRPMRGDHLISQRGRGGYLIIAVENRGPRGGLGAPVYQLLMLTVERATREQCAADPRCWRIKWDARKRRRAA
jgi:hypothetical protein